MSQGSVWPVFISWLSSEGVCSDSPYIIAFDCFHSRHSMTRSSKIRCYGLPGTWTGFTPHGSIVVCTTVGGTAMLVSGARIQSKLRNAKLVSRISLKAVNPRADADSESVTAYSESRTPWLEHNFSWETWTASSSCSDCSCTNCSALACSPPTRHFADRMALTMNSSACQGCLYLGKTLPQPEIRGTEDTGQLPLFAQMSALQFLKED